MLQYEFMRIAFLVGIMLGVIIPLIGTNLVFKRLAMTGDALSHASLSGVALGLLLGFSPVWTAMGVSVISGLIVEVIRKKFQKYSEISIAIIMSVGIGLAALLSSFTESANFENYLFGSIVAITQTELIITIILFVLVLAYFLVFYRQIMYSAFSETSAKIAGVKVNFINISYTTLSALTVAIATRTIGALLVSSLIVIPVASAMQVAKSYKGTIFYSILFSIISVILGIVASYEFGVKPGGAIVLIAVTILAVCMSIKPISKLILKIKANKKPKIKTQQIETETQPNPKRIKTK